MDFRFSLIEWISVTGLLQCVFVLVYIMLRVGNWRQTLITVFYFIVLGLSFILQFSLRITEWQSALRLCQWLAWGIMPPLCYLMVIQVAKMQLPRLRDFLVLLLLPLSALAFFILRDTLRVCPKGGWNCEDMFQWLYWINALGGIFCMVLLFSYRGLFVQLRQGKGGREKYWLTLSLILANMVVIFINTLRAGGPLESLESDVILSALGLGFGYIVISVMFRVYMPPVQLKERKLQLSAEEQTLADKVRLLMDVEKLYQEPAFSRAQMAQELSVSENILSRVINAAFGKSFPQLLSEYRVEDAKTLLRNKEIPIQTVAHESGFNSLASFNRVFKEISGETPSAYRDKKS